MTLSASTASREATDRRDTIKVRRMDLEFPDSMPTFWCDDNPLQTATLVALTACFPPGERFFISSVRHFLSRVEDPLLLEQVRAFVGQEANHTKEHIAFNRFLDSKGFPVTEMEEWVGKLLGRVQKRSRPEANLARTVALEHFTAIMAGALLEHPEVVETMHPAAAKLWVWHAIEEIEHKSVAFDVYKLAVDDEALRLRTMIGATVVFIALNSVRVGMVLKRTGTLWNLRSIAKGLNVLWGRPGIFRKLVPLYLSYFRKGFHPSQHDQSTLVEFAKRRYLGSQA
ncbi:metal-dependent hydrolase [Haliangium sp.]|uniref:metal-dependent hydrolase n=1 Tax=Haliangium sp. TaxID=2663208 RepID=UPI003D10E32C